MLPLRLEIEDFMAIRQADIDCTAFNSTLIFSRFIKNERESNAGGKSTIFRAISYLLFNVAPSSIEKIVRDGAKRCKVRFTFQIGNNKYRATRTRRKKASNFDLEQFMDNRWETVNQKTNSETGEELRKLIKISYKAFEQIGRAHV